MKNSILDVLDKNTQHLICPICKTNFNIDKGFIVCLNRHTFNITKAGYVNLALKKIKSVSEPELFKARKMLTQHSFFDSLEATIVKKLYDRFLKGDRVVILDAGCSEGSLFSSILLSLKWEGFVYTAIGVDSIKEAVKLAGREDDSVLWLVSDISNIPMADKSVDIILNTLSPANYSEFNRLLKDNGMVIKTMPDVDYLKEFRQKIGKAEDSNKRMVELFSQNLANAEEHNIRYVKKLNPEQRKFVGEMTSLNQKNGDFESNFKSIENVTVDLTILIGYKQQYSSIHSLANDGFSVIEDSV